MKKDFNYKWSIMWHKKSCDFEVMWFNSSNIFSSSSACTLPPCSASMASALNPSTSFLPYILPPPTPSPLVSKSLWRPSHMTGPPTPSQLWTLSSRPQMLVCSQNLAPSPQISSLLFPPTHLSSSSHSQTYLCTSTSNTISTLFSALLAFLTPFAPLNSFFITS